MTKDQKLDAKDTVDDLRECIESLKSNRPKDCSHLDQAIESAIFELEITLTDFRKKAKRYLVE